VSETESPFRRLPVAHWRYPGVEAWTCGIVHSPGVATVRGAQLEDSLSALNGRFATLVVEDQERRVRLIADPCASVPLYYVRRPHELFVSNNPNVDRTLVAAAIAVAFTAALHAVFVGGRATR
jgi:hypothetical protein